MSGDSTQVDTRWLRRYHPAPAAAPRLVCFPHAGGSAGYFHPVSAAVSPHADVLCVQYPGRQDRRTEPGITSVAELADRLYEVLRPCADRPLTFFGHSMGAVLAFEVALRFAKDGLDAPAHLFVSGRRAPSVHRDERVHLLPDEGMLAELVVLGGTGEQVLADQELRDMILPPLRSDYTAIETYRGEPGAVLDCPITALTGDADPRVAVDDVRVWESHTRGAFDLKVFPGGHFYLADQAPAVLGLIKAQLAGTPADR
ncbi:thioesterase II family protein [Kitasatospora brasiliensis]|uniref:thioesterase II family protein n=1 Tax=Kitasatospora brasiliensis TaxID=3058040 RepID=UPI002931E826|nr:alpha/beta fold hydrolase [Kitasatospora sp. K002]